jgi:hypothetical protein
MWGRGVAAPPTLEEQTMWGRGVAAPPTLEEQTMWGCGAAAPPTLEGGRNVAFLERKKST